MPVVLRILLILFSALAVYIVWKDIRKSKMKLIDGLGWILLAAAFLIISVFPQIIFAIGGLIGIESPVNLVFLLVIALLLLIVFRMSLKISRLEIRLEDLTEELAIREKDIRDRQESSK